MSNIFILFKSKIDIVINKFRSIGKHSTLKILFVNFCIFLFLLAIFMVSYKMFAMLQAIQEVGIVLVTRMLFLFFFSLFCLLIFSNIIVSYSTIYSSSEIEFLFTTPLKYKEIFTGKFIESSLLSSWTFVVLLIPFMSAYGIIKELPLYFYGALVFFFVPFLFIASSIGTFITLLLIRFIPRKYFKALFIALFVMSLFFMLATFRFGVKPRNLEDIFLLGKFAPYFKVSQCALLPSWWVTQGILSFNYGNLQDALFYWLCLFSTGIVSVRFLLFLSKQYYFSGWVLSHRSGQKEKFDSVSFVIDKLQTFWWFLKPKIKALVTKDVKLFWRDPVQWSQFIIFFGILAVYFANIQNVSYNLLPAKWKNFVAFLNLGSTTLVLASLSVRFVFPQFSLEGKRLWILGLAPLKLSTIILEKFWLWTITALLITMPLIILSNNMLNVSRMIMWISCAIVFIMCFALVGLSVGLGAIFPNFRDDNPAAIVSGFGGTLTFVINLFYVSLVVILIAIPFHLHFVLRAISHGAFIRQLIIVALLIFVISLLAACVPISLAIKRLKNMEF